MEKQYVFFLIAAFLYLVIGIPLALGRIRPNPNFGFRAKVLHSDPDLWYPVNRRAGIIMSVSGLLVLFVTLVLMHLRDIHPDVATLIGSLVIAAGFLVTAVSSKSLLRRLYNAKYEPERKDG